MLFLLATLLSVALCANYTITFSYAPGDTTCSGSYRGFFVQNNPSSCTPIGCSCLGSGCSQTLCSQTELPDQSGDWVVYGTYPTTDCSGEPSQYGAGASGVCANTTFLSTQTSEMRTCSNGVFRTRTWNSVSDCSGNPTTDVSVATGGAICQRVGSTSLYFGCNSVCFHKETTIGYEGKDLKLHDLATHEDCAIPHKVVSDGVKVKTSCPGVLRLTHNHLVMTADGWKKAGDLKKGEKLFSKVNAETADCEILSIETERKQHYFGLNCYNSDVLADGYWVSTFGSQHKIPSTWMRYGGAILGIQRASAIGDAVVTALEDWNILSRN